MADIVTIRIGVLIDHTFPDVNEPAGINLFISGWTRGLGIKHIQNFDSFIQASDEAYKVAQMRGYKSPLKYQVWLLNDIPFLAICKLYKFHFHMKSSVCTRELLEQLRHMKTTT